MSITANKTMAAEKISFKLKAISSIFGRAKLIALIGNPMPISRILILTLLFSGIVLRAQVGPADFQCHDGPEGYHWQQIGPSPEGMLQAAGLLGRVTVLPGDTNVLFVNTEFSGLWKTLNHGDRWYCITDSLEVPGLGLTELSINPENVSEFVAGTRTRSYGNPHWQGMGKGYGILFSDDGGVSWKRALMKGAQDDFEFVELVRRNPEEPDHLVAAGNRKIWVSTDGGKSWELAFENPTQLPSWFVDVEFSLRDTKRVFASTKLFGYGGEESKGGLSATSHAAQVFVSSASGKPGSWKEVSPPNTQHKQDFAVHIVMDVSPADPAHLYAVQALGNAHILHKTRDGSNWEMVDSVPRSGLVGGNWGYYRHEFELSDTDTKVMYAGTNTLLRSVDGGKSWKSVTQYIPYGNPGSSTHGDIRCILNLGPGPEGDRLIITNDGGVARTDDGGRTWTNLNGKGLVITEFYAVETFRASPEEKLVAGALHNGTFVYADSIWKPFVIGGDGDWTETDHFSDKERVYTMNNGRLSMSDDHGKTFRAVPGQPEARWVQGQRFEVDPHEHNRLLYGLYNLFRFDGRTNTWEHLFKKEVVDKTNSEITVAKIAPSDKGVLYLAFDGVTWGNTENDYKFYKSMDGGKSWENLTKKFTGSSGPMYHWAAISDLVFDPDNSQRAFVSVKNYGFVNKGNPVKDRVLYTEDGGETWSDMSAGLPPVPVNYLYYMDGSDDLVWAGTDAGVYYWATGAHRWMCFNRGFPSAIVTKLEVDPCNDVMYASTWGRGIWKVPLLEFKPLKEITGNQLWDTERFFNGRIVLKKGAVLNISDTLYMGEKGRIEIEPGAKLIVNGGAITVKNCGRHWQGVFRSDGKKAGPQILQTINGGSLLFVKEED
ncbi:MAG TPA: hypothetical protein DDW81_02525 [Cryomorphaceae bacterium]|nr:hypothetical protein [Cryomorphaceae bacterium]